MATPTAEEGLSGPVPVSYVGSRYFMYNPEHIKYLRKHHNIAGILIGTLPQSPQQNLFLGLPLQLMPEEARYLVERGIGFIVDDTQAHLQGIKNMTVADKTKWRAALERQGAEVVSQMKKDKDQGKQRALERQAKKKAKDGRMIKEGESGEGSGAVTPATPQEPKNDGELDPKPVAKDSSAPEEDLFFSNPDSSLDSRRDQAKNHAWQGQPYVITPTISYPPLPVPSPPEKPIVPSVSSMSAYALFTHLHDQSYFISPGIRFGCRYLAYPGDPLRFHSHFLADPFDWEEEVPLLRLIGGGRLGTGVKKGYLVGGLVQGGEVEGKDGLEKATSDPHCAEVRCFTIEWGSM